MPSNLIVILFITALYMMTLALLFRTKIEAWIIRTGRFSRIMSPYFRFVYCNDTSVLLKHYQIWQSLEEGLSPYSTFRVFVRAYGWTYIRYERATKILLYCRLICPTDRTEAGLNYLRILSAKSIAVEDPQYGTITINKKKK